MDVQRGSTFSCEAHSLGKGIRKMHIQWAAAKPALGRGQICSVC